MDQSDGHLGTAHGYRCAPYAAQSRPNPADCSASHGIGASSRKIARIAGVGLARSIAISSRARGLVCRRLQGKQVELLARSEKDAHGARNRHSDKEKFPSDLNRPGSYEMSERRLKTLRKSGDFQADYEGSIPFTRSKQFNGLARIFRFHSDNTADDGSKFVSVFRLAK
jgi:hypothetical protein